MDVAVLDSSRSNVLGTSAGHRSESTGLSEGCNVLSGAFIASSIMPASGSPPLQNLNLLKLALAQLGLKLLLPKSLRVFSVAGAGIGASNVKELETR
ncbi:hypothetical protein GOP47_0012169 [Adiantum capillus-veneris]|uniref:Uncharacterized protein n=1 Tax=Adiantum capillus-veneris TaxID=13818 RepID=A0A9D4URJ4_ADICA|nr:hypothetical protein GOP47_0012169 [Adiantum capillus-veneris]